MLRLFRRHAAISALALGIALLVIISPLLLQLLARTSADWAKLSDVGQAYGAASAALAGIALCGVAASLIVQQQQTRISLLGAIRGAQLDLVKYSLDNPDLLESWGIDTAAPDLRIRMFSNLIMSYWHALWAIDGITERELRSNLQTFFEMPINRGYWSNTRSGWLGDDLRTTRFLSIVDSEAQRAANAPGVRRESGRALKRASQKTQDPRSENAGRGSHFPALALGGLLGLAIGAALRRNAQS